MAGLTPPGLRREPELPPGFSLVTLREAGDAFAHARAIAPEAGAATLVWTRRFDLVEFALVLEPDEPLGAARLVHYAGMNALADALAFHGPAEKPIAFAWPDAVHFDGGLLGGGRLCWPEGTDEGERPDFLVFGAMLRASSLAYLDPGLATIGVALDEEGFSEVDFADLIDSFSRHFMSEVHVWNEDGPRPVVQRWIDRMPKLPGVEQGIDRNGDLLATRDGATERRALAAALAAPSWLDPETGEPWL